MQPQRFDEESEYSLRPRWVFPASSPPLENGVITIARGRIVSLSPADAVEPVVELPEAVILPGLVNAHTHLEFSGLVKPLGLPGNRMPDWIAEVLKYRRSMSAMDSQQAIAAGLQESLAGGATVVGEIATGDWPAPAEQHPHATVFREAIGLSEERATQQLEVAKTFLDTFSTTQTHRAGLSPHAPYTVRPALCQALAELARQRNVPLAMHLAETREELELLRDGSGPLGTFLTGMGFLPAGAIPASARPLDYLRMISAAPQALVIHGNYLDAEELDYLAEHRATTSLVYCPRTHVFFGHTPYHRLSDLAQRGVRVCLGTDSRASNPDLSILSELRFVAQRTRDLAGEEVLRLATTAGAEALGLADTHGRIAVGRAANLCVARVINRVARDPYELLWDETAEVIATLIRGKVVHARPGFADLAT